MEAARGLSQRQKKYLGPIPVWIGPRLCLPDCVAQSFFRAWSLRQDYACCGVEEERGSRRALEIEHAIQFAGNHVVEPLPIRPRLQLSSMKRRIDNWSVTRWSMKSCFAKGEMTSKGSRGPYPQRPFCAVPPSCVAVVPQLPGLTSRAALTFGAARN